MNDGKAISLVEKRGVEAIRHISFTADGKDFMCFLQGLLNLDFNTMLKLDAVRDAGAVGLLQGKMLATKLLLELFEKAQQPDDVVQEDSDPHGAGQV